MLKLDLVIAAPISEALHSGPIVSIGYAALLLVLGIPIWEAFVRKEVKFGWLFASNITPPWSYFAAAVFIAAFCFILIIDVGSAFWVFNACNFTVSCIGQAYLSALLQPVLILWCAMMSGYFILWLRNKPKKEPPSTQIEAKKRTYKEAIRTKKLS
jgi:hypothetical protein